MALEKTGQLVTVIGASGFVGRYVVQELCRSGVLGGTGVRVRALCRNTTAALFLKPLGGLGQVQIGGVDITRPDSLAAALAGSDVVINLVGVLNGDFGRIQASGAEAVAKAARAAGAGALVHVSAIGADPESPSAYGRSKGEGEALVRAAFPGATIIRPSVVFGPEDNFINRLARMVRTLPVVPVVRPAVRFQPIWVGDLAQAIARAAVDHVTYGGRVFELGGPRTYSFEELVRWVVETVRCRRSIIAVPDCIGSMIASAGFLPGAPITKDQWLMLQRDNVVAPGAEGIAAFGIEPSPLEAIAPSWLVRYRKHGRFNIPTAAEAR